MNTRVWVPLLFVWFLPAPLVSQGKVDSTSYPPRQAYRHTLRISAPYDPDQGKTVLQTKPFVLDSNLSLSMVAALDGRTVTKPATSIVFTFWSTGPAGRYAGDHSVHVVLGGRDTLNLGNAWLVPNHRAEYNEVLLKGLFLAQFLAIANASTVTIRVGPSTVPLTAAQMQGLRDFASRMAPVPSR